jgi:hypothetical protein
MNVGGVIDIGNIIVDVYITGVEKVLKKKLPSLLSQAAYMLQINEERMGRSGMIHLNLTNKYCKAEIQKSVDEIFRLRKCMMEQVRLYMSDGMVVRVKNIGMISGLVEEEMKKVKGLVNCIWVIPPLPDWRREVSESISPM